MAHYICKKVSLQIDYKEKILPRNNIENAQIKEIHILLGGDY